MLFRSPHSFSVSYFICIYYSPGCLERDVYPKKCGPLGADSLIKFEDSCPINLRKTRLKPPQHARKNRHICYNKKQAHRVIWQPTKKRAHVVEENSIVEVAIRCHRHRTYVRATPTPPSTTTKVALTASKRRGLHRADTGTDHASHVIVVADTPPLQLRLQEDK